MATCPGVSPRRAPTFRRRSTSWRFCVSLGSWNSAFRLRQSCGAPRQSRAMDSASAHWSLEAKFAGNTGKVKAQVSSRMHEQACEMQANPIQFVGERILWRSRHTASFFLLSVYSIQRMTCTRTDPGMISTQVGRLFFGACLSANCSLIWTWIFLACSSPLGMFGNGVLWVVTSAMRFIIGSFSRVFWVCLDWVGDIGEKEMGVIGRMLLRLFMTETYHAA
jgi:hypothetical protein